MMIKRLSFLSLIAVIFVFAYQKRHSHFTEQDVEIEYDLETKKIESVSPQKNEPSLFQKNHENVSKQDEITSTSAPSDHMARSFDFDEHMFNEEGELVVSQVLVVEEYAIAHGDILIGTYDEMLDLEKQGQLPTLKSPGLWEEGIIPYTIDSDYMYQERIEAVIKYFHQETPVRFVPWDGVTEDYVIFAPGPEHCFAHLGRRGGPQKVVLSSGCYEAEIAHEIMHVLGFLHEQNREDRDNYLSIHWTNIEEVYHEQFKKMPNPFTRGIELPFDLQSIMIYSPFSFAIDSNRPTMTQKNGQLYERASQILSPGDKKKIETLYGKKRNTR